MYESHFGLRQRPFHSIPDTRFYYPAQAHEEALQVLQRGLADEEPLMLLAGEPGSGKTLLGMLWLERLGSQASCAFLPNSHLARPADLFQALLFDFGLPFEGKSEQELRLALTEHLLAEFDQDRRTVLLVDEAHLLAPAVLEEIRLLGNLESRRGRVVQTVLLAQPAIHETLKRDELRSLRQRLAARAALAPLADDEAADYVRHRLRIAGARPDALVTEEALETIVQACAGSPRRLNQLTHLALRLTCLAEAGQVDAEGVLEAQIQLGWIAEEAAAEAPAPEALLAERSESPPRLIIVPGQTG